MDFYSVKSHRYDPLNMNITSSKHNLKLSYFITSINHTSTIIIQYSNLLMNDIQ